MRSRRLAALAGLAGALVAVPAAACTPAPGYRVPTNLELAEAANLILLGEVVRAAPGREGDEEADPVAPGIVVQPVAALKGLAPTGDLVLRGMALADPRRPAEAVPSEPLEFAEAHPQSFTGACVRRVFPQGARVLFFLAREEGQWVPAGGPFSRWAEDVGGREAPWAQLATLYAHASQLPPGERTALLQDQIEALQARQDSQVALAMATDVERQLAGPNPPLVPARPAAEATAEPEEPSAVQRAIDAMRDD